MYVPHMYSMVSRLLHTGMINFNSNSGKVEMYGKASDANVTASFY